MRAHLLLPLLVARRLHWNVATCIKSGGKGDWRRPDSERCRWLPPLQPTGAHRLHRDVHHADTADSAAKAKSEAAPAQPRAWREQESLEGRLRSWKCRIKLAELPSSTRAQYALASNGCYPAAHADVAMAVGPTMGSCYYAWGPSEELAQSQVSYARDRADTHAVKGMRPMHLPDSCKSCCRI